MTLPLMLILLVLFGILLLKFFQKNLIRENEYQISKATNLAQFVKSAWINQVLCKSSPEFPQTLPKGVEELCSSFSRRGIDLAEFYELITEIMLLEANFLKRKALILNTFMIRLSFFLGGGAFIKVFIEQMGVQNKNIPFLFRQTIVEEFTLMIIGIFVAGISLLVLNEFYPTSFINRPWFKSFIHNFREIQTGVKIPLSNGFGGILHQLQALEQKLGIGMAKEVYLLFSFFVKEQYGEFESIEKNFTGTLVCFDLIAFSYLSMCFLGPEIIKIVQQV